MSLREAVDGLTSRPYSAESGAERKVIVIMALIAIFIGAFGVIGALIVDSGLGVALSGIIVAKAINYIGRHKVIRNDLIIYGLAIALTLSGATFDWNNVKRGFSRSVEVGSNAISGIDMPSSSGGSSAVSRTPITNSSSPVIVSSAIKKGDIVVVGGKKCRVSAFGSSRYQIRNTATWNNLETPQQEWCACLSGTERNKPAYASNQGQQVFLKKCGFK